MIKYTNKMTVINFFNFAIDYINRIYNELITTVNITITNLLTKIKYINLNIYFKHS